MMMIQKRIMEKQKIGDVYIHIIWRWIHRNTPTISFYRCHEDSEIVTEMTSKVGLVKRKATNHWAFIILSAFNHQYINKNVLQLYIPIVILGMSIKKAHHETNQEKCFQQSWFMKIINMKFWRRLYPWNLALNKLKLFAGSYSIDFIKILRFSSKCNPKNGPCHPKSSM